MKKIIRGTLLPLLLLFVMVFGGCSIRTQVDASAQVPSLTEAGTKEETAAVTTVTESGTYTGKDEVAMYLHLYGHLPSNYITKKEAKELGWESNKGNLDEIAPGKSIGGDYFGNYDEQLPEKKGRQYTECDINYEGGYRGGERIAFSNDGLIFYSDDHYNTFVEITFQD